MRLMEKSKFDQELECNREAYERLRDRIRKEFGQQYVAIAQGKLLGSAPTFDEASSLIFKLSPQPKHFLVFEAGNEPAFEPVYDAHCAVLHNGSVLDD